MPKIVQFDATTVRAISQKAVAALQAVCEEHGLTVTNAGGTFGSLEFTCKLAFRVADPVMAGDAARAAWDRHAGFMGINVAAFGKVFRQGGKAYKIVGCAPGRPKYCVRAQEIFTGKELLFPAGVTQGALA